MVLLIHIQSNQKENNKVKQASRRREIKYFIRVKREKRKKLKRERNKERSERLDSTRRTNWAWSLKELQIFEIVTGKVG